MLRHFILLACWIFCPAAHGFPAPKSSEPTNEELIVGTWELVGDEFHEFEHRFTKDGNLNVLLVKYENAGITRKSVITDGTYKVNGDKMAVTIKNKDGTRSTNHSKIKTLTADTLVTIGDDGTEGRFRRKQLDPSTIK